MCVDSSLIGGQWSVADGIRSSDVHRNVHVRCVLNHVFECFYVWFKNGRLLANTPKHVFQATLNQ